MTEPVILGRRFNGPPGSAHGGYACGVVASLMEGPEPDPVNPAEAQSAAHVCPGFQTHEYPTCFGCGAARSEGDGLRILSGPVPGRRLVTAPWTTAPSVLDEHDQVRSEFVWAILD